MTFVIADTNEPERVQQQPTTTTNSSDSASHAQSQQRPAVWNPFLAVVTPASDSPGGPREPAKLGATATKHPHPADDETLSSAAAAKKRKISSAHDDGKTELADAAGVRSCAGGQSPSSSTPLDTEVHDGGDPATTDARNSGSGGVCAPDSSCDKRQSSPDIKRFDCVVKQPAQHNNARPSGVQKDLTIVQDTSSLLQPLASQ